MAVPAYTTDLATLDLAEANTNWAEPTATGWTLGAAPGTADSENAIQGTNAVPKAFNATGVGGMLLNFGSSPTIPTDGVFMGWLFFASPANIDTLANGGMRMVAGSALNNFKGWTVGGSNTYAYGGWINVAVDPTLTADYTETGTGTNQYFGWVVKTLSNITKGSPFVTDAFRYGRAQSKFTGGETANYATIAGYAAINDTTANRWGLIQAISGGYLMKGRLLLGLTSVTTSSRARNASNVATLVTATAHNLNVGDTFTTTGIGGTGYNVTAVVASVVSTTSFTYSNTGGSEGTTADTGGTVAAPVDFRDSNRAIIIDNTTKVATNFNEIEVRGTGSRVDMTGFTFTAVGTVSKGRWVTTDAADVNLLNCTFTDMNTFTFLVGDSVLACTFRRCGQITAPGSDLTGCNVDSYTGAADTSAVVWNVNTDPDGLLDDMTFTKGTNAHHAIQLGTSSPLTVTFRGITFSGFNASDAQNDSVIYLSDRGSDQSWTLNAVGCTGTVSYKKQRSGDTVTVVQDPVTTTITVTSISTGLPIENARVLVTASDNTGTMPFDETVTGITRVSSTATVAHTSHGLISGKKVLIKGATQSEYNGVFTISNVSANAYDYTVSGTPTTPATGTIKATGVVIDGLTDVNGVISDTRTHAVDQPITGRVRKATGGTLYKTGSISGTIDSANGFSTTIQLIGDT